MSEKPITVILGTHPNEEVGRVIGQLAVQEWRRAGREIEVISLPTVIDGKPWYERFAEPGGLTARNAHEVLVAAEREGLCLSFHDGPLPFGNRGEIWRHQDKLLVVEINAPYWEETEDSERRRFAGIALARGDRYAATCIGSGSIWDSIASLRLKPKTLVPFLIAIARDAEGMKTYFNWSF